MNNSKTILVLVFLIAGALLTTTVTTIVPAAYADDDHDGKKRHHDKDGDGNKNKAEDNSAAAIADCDKNDVERAGFDCFGIAVNDIEVSEEDGGDGGITFPVTICHNPANGPPTTMEAQNQQEFDAHINTDVPGHEDDHVGECEEGET
jgi:hypothetical protein